ncbi:MAG: hypothetical protein NVS3B3_19550 [Aquirhabdus sp.]
MGWFKTGTKEKAGLFIVAGDKHPERSYGYLAVRWSVDNANGMLETILKMPSTPGTSSLVTRIKGDPWRAFIQLRIFYIAMYLAYAEIILKISEHALGEINIGFQDGLKDLLAPNKIPIDTKLQSYMQREVRDYIFAIQAELNSEIQPGIVDFTGGQTCEAFIRSLHRLYIVTPDMPETFDVTEILELTLRFGHKPAKFMLILRDDVQIKYQPA